MKLKYLLYAVIGAVSFGSAVQAWGDSYGPRIWALTRGENDGAGHIDVDLYCIDLITGKYEKAGRLPRFVGGDKLAGGHWSGLAVKDHNLYFCTKDRYTSKNAPRSEIIACLARGDTNHITVDIKGIIDLKKVGEIGFLADIGGMCVGPDGMLYLADVAATVPGNWFAPYNSSSLPDPYNTSSLLRFDPNGKSDAVQIGFFKDSVPIGDRDAAGNPIGKLDFHGDIDCRPGTGDLLGIGQVSTASSHDNVFSIGGPTYMSYAGSPLLFTYNTWFDGIFLNPGHPDEPTGLAFRKSTGELFDTQSSGDINVFNSTFVTFQPKFTAPTGTPILNAIKVEEDLHDRRFELPPLHWWPESLYPLEDPSWQKLLESMDSELKGYVDEFLLGLALTQAANLVDNQLSGSLRAIGIKQMEIAFKKLQAHLSSGR